jgi:hypothetical protein
MGFPSFTGCSKSCGNFFLKFYDPTKMAIVEAINLRVDLTTNLLLILN